MILKPEQLIIPDEKILDYLLLPKEKNDKSGFLSGLGFNRANYPELVEEIRKIATTNEAILSRTNEFGNLTKLKENLKIVLLSLSGLNRLKIINFVL